MPESSTLTTRLPSDPFVHVHKGPVIIQLGAFCRPGCVCVCVCVCGWVCGGELVMVSGRRVVLRDEDASSVSVGKNARRLNTLAHYRVVDGSTLAVRTRYTAAAKPANGEYRTQRPKHTLAASTTFALEKSQDRQTDRRTDGRRPGSRFTKYLTIYL